MRLKQKISLYLISCIVLLNIVIFALFVAEVQNVFVLVGIVLSLDVILVILVLRSADMIVHPLGRITETLESIIKGENKRLEVNSPSEFYSLVNRINYLLDRHDSSDNTLKEVQERITQTQRWVLLGRLASGVVHEINNPLDGVINCIHTIRSKRLTKKQTDRYLELVADGLFRIETITKRLLGLSREHPLCLVEANLNELTEKASFFVDYRMTQKRISLRCKFMSNLPSIKVDHGAILQVLVNIYLNAIESMPKGGVLSITTTFDESWVKIMVADTGKGISRDKLDKIFLPFFTTKEEGIGLGLSICQNIIEQHEGEIEVESIPNKGTIFTIKLPVDLQ